MSDIISVSNGIAVTATTLHDANGTGIDVLGLSLPPLSQIENTSREINESTVPVAEINATIRQSRQSKMQALEAVEVAEEARSDSMGRSLCFSK